MSAKETPEKVIPEKVIPEKVIPKKVIPEKVIPDHLGHRQRLKEKFRKNGRAALADYELVELILYRALPRGNVKPLAKALLKTFGSFANLIHTERADIEAVKGAGASVADELQLIRESITHALRVKLENRPLLTAWQDLFNYCEQEIGYKPIECLHIFYLDAKHYLIKNEMMTEGTVNRTSVFPREVLRRAINHNAHSVVLVHNHPSGDAKPSREDILLTKEIASVLKSAHIKLHDHIIVARGKTSSFQELLLFEALDP